MVLTYSYYRHTANHHLESSFNNSPSGVINHVDGF